MGIIKNQRVEYIDALKGFAVFCVLWGHSLQYLNDDSDFFKNQMFEFIYSFHMPLFFIISGFFFQSALKLSLLQFILKKSKQLLLPCIVWTVISYLTTCFDCFDGGNSEFMWHNLFKVIIQPSGWIWFLRELFVSYILVYFSFKIFKKTFLACFVCVVFVLFAPYCDVQRSLLPFFLLGLFLKNYYSVIFKYKKQLLVVTGVGFGVCLLFWDGNYTMYVSAFKGLVNFKKLSFDLANIDISLFRLIVGVFGSLFWFFVFERTYSKNVFFSFLSNIGINSLAIYLIQRLVLEQYVNNIVNFTHMQITIYNLVVTPIIAFVVLVICHNIAKIINRNKYAKFLLFGSI